MTGRTRRDEISAAAAVLVELLDPSGDDGHRSEHG